MTQKRIADALTALLRAWLVADSSAENLNVVAGLVEPHRSLIPLDFQVELWEQLGLYDRALRTCRRAVEYCSPTKQQEWSREAVLRGKAMEESGRMEAAGLWYLCGSRVDQTQRCWVHLEPTESNTECLTAIGQGARAAESLMKAGKAAEAAGVYRAFGDVDRAVSALLSAGEVSYAAYVLEVEKRYEHAYRLYMEADRKEEAARMLERLKRYKEAAELYRSVGNVRKYESCRKKTSRATQLPLETW